MPEYSACMFVKSDEGIHSLEWSSDYLLTLIISVGAGKQTWLHSKSNTCYMCS